MFRAFIPLLGMVPFLRIGNGPFLRFWDRPVPRVRELSRSSGSCSLWSKCSSWSPPWPCGTPPGANCVLCLPMYCILLQIWPETQIYTHWRSVLWKMLAVGSSNVMPIFPSVDQQRHQERLWRHPVSLRTLLVFASFWLCDFVLLHLVLEGTELASPEWTSISIILITWCKLSTIFAHDRVCV